MDNKKTIKPATRREERRNATIEEIKATAWEQMEKNGPSAISLREISRTMRMSSAAIYRYFSSQADLLGALSKDALQSQIGSLLASVRDSEEDVPGRLIKLGVEYRRWAVENPVRYMLVHGTPVPGYKQDWNDLVPVLRHGLEILLSLLEEGLAKGQLRIPVRNQLRPELIEKLQALMRDREYDMDPGILYMAIVVWSRIHGMVSLEINGQLKLLVSTPDELYRSELELLVKSLQNTPEPNY